MIGVVANESDYDAVREFFELFKTPWEFHRPGARYEVLLSSNAVIPENDARLLLLYGSGRQEFDDRHNVHSKATPGPEMVSFRGERLPIFGSVLLFEKTSNAILLHEEGARSVGVRIESGSQVVVRLGFDLFAEVDYLLIRGQPATTASIPVIDLHIALLRELIVECGVLHVEVPPVPAGYAFTACLTHDVDHFRLQHHRWDRATLGFIYRASLGSVVSFCRGRKSLRQVFANWRAVISLPFVYAGLAKDFWDQLDRYAELEMNLAPTFFIVARSGHPGLSPDGSIKRKRAVRYSARDAVSRLQSLDFAESEIALHGIDAWRESSSGRQECALIQRLTKTSEMGVRMHWLYFDLQSPAVLEEAGFTYDATVGYNDTIGYRAGTAQVYKHLGVDRLLELPLHVMDTALFYRSYLDLSEKAARIAVLHLIDNAVRLGGVFTVNWHDRSLGPERLWDNSYLNLLHDLRAKKPWFATAIQAVSWFRKRRMVSFSNVAGEPGNVHVQLSGERGTAALPALTVRVYNGAGSKTNTRGSQSSMFEDFTIDEADDLLIAA